MIVTVSAVPLKKENRWMEDRTELTLAIGELVNYPNDNHVHIKGKTVSAIIHGKTLVQELASDESQICTLDDPRSLPKEDNPGGSTKIYYIGGDPQKGVDIYRQIISGAVTAVERGRAKNPVNESELL